MFESVHQQFIQTSNLPTHRGLYLDTTGKYNRMLEDVVSWPGTENKCASSLIKPSFSKEIEPPQCCKARLKYRPEDDILVHSTTQAEPRAGGELVLRLATNTLTHTQNPQTSLNNLPLEIQEGIIDYTHGSLGSATFDGSGVGHNARNWSRVMRHPRRKQLSNLALVSKTIRKLVQQRLYRHIRIKGTKEELEECISWFLAHPDLQSYVKHLEIWVPLWEVKDGRSGMRKQVEVLLNDGRPAPRAAHTHTTWFSGNRDRHLVESSNIALAYQPATHNATLDEIFDCAQLLFPQVCALTIEGGHCKKPPRIPYFRQAQTVPEHELTMRDEEPLYARYLTSLTPAAKPQLAVLPNVGTLILKGAWNIIRTDKDFQILSQALPNLREWHCAYSKPKTDGYMAMCRILQQFPRTIVRLDICLEGLYVKEDISVMKWRKVYPENHVCLDLGLLAPQLERFAYTGRMCGKLFQTASTTAITGSRDRPPLKSVDLVVKNCCREHPGSWTDGTGIHHLEFILLFRKLVIEACRALEVYTEISYLRIRFIDLDSPNQLMNPYFHFQPNGKCAGFWDEDILALLQKARPGVVFEGTEEEISHEDVVDIDKVKRWPRSIHVRRYLEIADPGNSMSS